MESRRGARELVLGWTLAIHEQTEQPLREIWPLLCEAAHVNSIFVLGRRDPTIRRIMFKLD